MAIIKRPETAILYCKFKYRGKQYFRSTGSANKREAEAFERRLRTELETQGENPKALHPTLAVLRDMDMNRAVGEGKNLDYIKHGIGLHWKWLIEFFADTSKVTPDTLRAYVRDRQKDGISGQTIRKELTTLKRGLKLADASGHPIKIPTVWPRLANSPQDSKQEGRLVEQAAVVDFIAGLEGQAQDLALLALLTGLRRAELFRIEPSWLKLLPATPATPIAAILRLPAWATKGRKKREVGLVPAALEIVQRATPFKPLDHKRTWRRAAKAAGETTRTIHLRDLRHTFATVAADRSHDELGVALVLGHTSGVMTLRYQTANTERLAKIAVAVWGWYEAGINGVRDV